ncbi:hypothetical protein ACSSV1_001891 [Labrenzia sp. MBR-25]
MTTRIYLEDHGQDFLSFSLTDDNRITDANFQGQIWNGLKVENDPLRAGDLIVLEDGYVLKYPISVIETKVEFDK